MPYLIASAETALDTGYALLYVLQQGSSERPNSTTFAASAPGGIAMMCGTRHARLHVRLERWDSVPPVAEPEWEDRDELPWEPVPDGGPLLTSGDGPPAASAPPLDVDGLTRARVEVLAAGRHRYRYSYRGAVEDLPRERWLLRFWPDEDAQDALAGPPRRIAGRLPFEHYFRGWLATLHAWRQTGWETEFSGIQGFESIASALRLVGRPCTAEELVPLLGGPGHEADPFTMDSPVLRLGPAYPELFPDRQPILDRLAAAAEMGSVATFGDALTCLQRLGLLATWRTPDAELLVPTGAPRPVWEVLAVSAKEERRLRVQALASDFDYLVDDILHVLEWAPEHRVTITPQRLGVRLAVSADDIVRALQLAVLLEKIAVEGDLDQGDLEQVGSALVTIVRRASR